MGSIGFSSPASITVGNSGVTKTMSSVFCLSRLVLLKIAPIRGMLESPGMRLTVSVMRLSMRSDDKALPRHQLDIGRHPTCGQCRYDETYDRRCVGKVESADLGRDVHLDRTPIGELRQKIKPDPKLSELDRNRTRCGTTLNDRDGEFTSHQEVRLLAGR